ncbi:MAG: HIT domain-containing protein [Candidatus Omnitrophota bacterium]
MKHIWAPWRKKYVFTKIRGCIFCKKTGSGKNSVVAKTRYSYVMLNKFPYNNGHIMVVPKRHVKNLYGLSEKELLDLINLVALSTKVLKKTLKPHAYNIGLNLGRTAGAGYAGHLHFHIVPRWHGDTNFMPIISNTKVIPESLNELGGRLKVAFNSKRNKNMGK